MLTLTSGHDEHDEEIKRPYTPISRPSQEGQLELLIKVYKANEMYPNGGVLTRYLSTLHEGDVVFVDGPVGKCIYQGDGVFEL